MNKLAQLCRIVFIERRLPGRIHQMYFSFLNKLGIRCAIVKSPNGLRIKGYTRCFSMYYEIWGKRDYDIASFALADNMAVIDIGANQGFFSLYAASQGATVYAFEPCAENFEMLKWNVATNHLSDRVKLFNSAVTGKGGTVPLFVGLDASGEVLSGSVSILDENRGGKTVQTRAVESVSLDALLAELPTCDFLKIDCEGAEYEILQNTSRASFRKIARIAMECHSGRIGEAAKLLSDAGFEIVYQRPGETGVLKAVNRHLRRPLESRDAGVNASSSGGRGAVGVVSARAAYDLVK